jgi:hypothetical protein
MSIYEPAHQSLSTWNARQTFYQYIRHIAPEVLEDLRDEPFYYYRVAFVMNRWHRSENEHARKWGVFESEPYERHPSVLALKQSLLEWAEYYNLNDQWCLDKAFRTLDQWYQNSAFAERLMWGREAIGYIPPVGVEEGKFSFTFPTWDPVSQSRSSYQEEVERAFRQYRIRYCNRIEELTRERDYVERKRKRDSAHYEWLVWYQVKYKSQSWIVQEFNATRATVAEAIKGAASMCGLTLRPRNAAGRPRKS